jgi:hypothetical protein
VLREGSEDTKNAQEQGMADKLFAGRVGATFDDFCPVRDVALSTKEARDVSGTRGRRPLLPPSVVAEAMANDARHRGSDILH